MRRIALLLAALAACADAGGEFEHERDVLDGKSDNPLPTKAWTFLLYGAADNNLASFIHTDVDELESVGSSADVNFVALLDTPQGARRMFLEQDGDRSTLSSPSAELGAIDSGAPETLEAFLRWGTSTFPARHYALVISGHGGGDPRVIAPDDGTGHALAPTQIAAAVQRVFGAGRKLDVLGADACLMQTVEVAVELSGSVRYLVGSQNTEPGEGWPYDVIGRELREDPQLDGGALADAMTTAYAHSQPFGGDATISNLELAGLTSGAPAYQEQLEDFARVLAARARGDAQVRANVSAALARTFRAHGGGFVPGDADPFGDLDRFLFLLEHVGDADLERRVADLRATSFMLERLTFVGLAADSQGARGVGVYLPPRPSPATIDRYAASCRFCATWAELVAAYAP